MISVQIHHEASFSELLNYLKAKVRLTLSTSNLYLVRRLRKKNTHLSGVWLTVAPYRKNHDLSWRQPEGPSLGKTRSDEGRGDHISCLRGTIIDDDHLLTISHQSFQPKLRSFSPESPELPCGSSPVCAAVRLV